MRGRPLPTRDGPEYDRPCEAGIDGGLPDAYDPGAAGSGVRAGVVAVLVAAHGAGRFGARPAARQEARRMEDALAAMPARASPAWGTRWLPG